MARNSNGFLSTDTELIGFGSGKEYSGASGIYVDNENNVISITGEVGKEYNGIEPIVVNNEENLISANSAPIGVQEPLYFVQDDDEAVIIGLSGEYVTPSDITGKLDTSSFESWQQGQYTNDLTAINEKINEVSSNIPSLEGYATEQWVEDKGYLTAVSIPESANWEDTSEVVKTNSGTWNTVTDKLDVTAQVISSCETSSIDDKTLVTKLNGNEIAVSYAGSAHVADIALKDYQGNSFVPFYAKTSALEEKLDTTAFSDVSGSFLTAHQSLSNYYTKDETSGKEELTQAFANIPGGDPEVNAYVHSHSASIDNTSDLVQSNSSTWNDVTAYQYNSASYATTVNIGSNQYGQITGYNSSAIFATASKQAQCDVFNRPITSTYYTTAEANTLSSMLSGAIDYVSANAGGAITSYTTATIEGTNAINSLNGKPLISFRTQSAQFAGVAENARYDYNGNNLADDHNSLTALNNVVQTNSATWGQGGNIPVSNSGDLYKVEFDGVDLYGYKSTTTITSEPVYSAVSSQKSNYIQHTPYPQWNNYTIQNLENWSAFDIISISSNGGQIYPPQYGDYGYVTALDVYYKAQYVYDYNDHQLADFSGYVGKITLDNLVISSYFDKPSYFDNIKRVSEFRLWFSGNQHEGQLYNSHYICSVGNKVQPEHKTVEGIFVIPQSALPTYEYDNTNKISAINGSAIAAGDEFPISADEAITTYQSNSALYLTAQQNADWTATAGVTQILNKPEEVSYELLNLSAGPGIDIQETQDALVISATGGAWGGSALPISAGPGIGLSMVDGVLVISVTGGN